jgi:hypothetical protein
MGARAAFYRAAYRVRQFIRALSASWRPLTEHEAAEARNQLPAGAWSLFQGMDRGDQRHSLNVLRTLQACGTTDPALLQAALIHDCAKRSGGVRIWHRVAVVLLRAFWPAGLAPWETARAPIRSSWQYPFWAHLHHAERGAEMAAAAGCNEQVVWLIAHHQDHTARVAASPADLNALRVLQAADDDN